ncbi:hypothetical protein OG21DRAFT_1601490 [Imleria badia]|nr:hypothetical protein OG21DRAFT_1601490 [Imleria badia]
MADVRVFGTRYFRQIAGFWQHGNTTISVFYKWLNEFTLIVAQNWALYPSNSDSDRSGKPAGPALQRDSVEILTPGDYVILGSDGKLCRVGLVNKSHLPRSDSAVNIGTHWDQSEANFVSRVCERDMRCCLTGKEVPHDVQNAHNFVDFKVARIFPLGAKKEFFRFFSRHIKDPDIDEDDKINSVQQGFLVCSAWYHNYTMYKVGVNPDDGYRITDFNHDNGPSSVDGRTFYINPNVPAHYRPCPELLKDHFRRCLLMNVRVLPIFPFAVQDDCDLCDCQL